MFGIFLAILATFFLEASTAIGKTEVSKKKESIYALGFLSLFWSCVWFLMIVIHKGGLVFSMASLPTFLARIGLEIIVAEISIRAIVKADRSSYGFIRIITIPAILIVDLLLGYSLDIKQFIGIGIILSSVLLVLSLRQIDKRGLGLVAVGSLLAAGTISLFKYNITHFNSVETEQFLAQGFLVLYFLVAILRAGSENPFRMLFKNPFAAQSLTHGLASVVASFAFVFAPASIIVTAERSSSILWAIISGNHFFHEKHLLHKIGIFAVISLGIYLLI